MADLPTFAVLQTLAMPVLLALIGGYLLGSIPFGLVLTKSFGYDLRSIGSGNIGATNVLRTGRKDLALATLLLDSGKGAIAAAIAWMVAPSVLQADTLSLGALLMILAAGFGAVIGHNFPLWLGFKGGKGVATTLGVLLITAWPVGVGACLTWLLVAAVFRYSSLAALVALCAAPAYALWLATPVHAAVYAVLALLAMIRHHENIRRLLRGEESKIGKKKG